MKLAISISGETRTYNDQKNHENFHIALDTLFGEYDYDLYGHTWNNCESPIDENKFTYFFKTDPNEIWDTFVKKDLFNLVPYRQEWNTSAPYLQALEDPIKLVEYIKAASIGGYAQIWSWDKTIRAILPNISQYSAVIRWRWDSQLINNDNYIAVAKDIINKFIRGKDEFLDPMFSGSAIMTTAPYVTNNFNSLGDTFFVVLPEGITSMCRQTVQKNLSFTINTTMPERPTAHGLWYHYFNSIGLQTVAAMPDVRGTSNLDNYIKTNKQLFI